MSYLYFSLITAQAVTGVPVARWGWPIPLYFFLGGVTAASLILLQFPGLLELKISPARQRWLLVGQLVALLIGSALLTLDLTKPERFWQIFLNFNVTSFLAIGSRLLIFLIALTLLQLWYVSHNQPVPSVYKWVSLLFEAALILYPAFLLFSDPRDAWKNPLVLLDFPVTALLGGSAVVLLLAGWTAFSQRRVQRWFIGLTALEVILLLARLVWVNTGSHEGNQAVSSVISGDYALAFWLGQVLIGLLLPLVALLFLARFNRTTEASTASSIRWLNLNTVLRAVVIFILVGLIFSKFILVNAI